MKLEHNSRSSVYRKPFGAVTVFDEVSLSLAVKDLGIPHRITLHIYTKGGEKCINMAYYHSIGEYNIYTATAIMPDKPQKVFYTFEIVTDSGTMWYGNNHSRLGGVGEEYTSCPDSKFQITVYKKDYKTPDWFKNSVCYQIFPDRFYKSGDFLSDKPHMKKRCWGEIPYHTPEQFGGVYDCSDFFGGNLKGIEEKLGYLKELGIDAIYLNPVFEAYSNHRYDTGNYENIDPLLGTNEDFERLCRSAEGMGIRIILDGVFNHTGSNSKYFNKNGSYSSVGAYNSKESPYFDWFRFSTWPTEYESWWGMLTLPQLEENNPTLREYLLNGKDAIVKRWIKSGAYGWRLDVADELPDSFIKELRENVKAVNPEAVIIGEVWEDASNKVAYGEDREYLLGDELDSVMNYPLRNSLIDFALGRCNACEFDNRISSIRENYPKEAFYSLLNFLSSHDVERIITVLSGIDCPENRAEAAKIKLSVVEYERAKKKLFAVMTLQMTLPGVPCIFYGDEAGLQGFCDPFCRSCYPWGEEDNAIKEKLKTLIAMRKSSDAFTKGEMETVYCYNSGYAMIRTYGSEKFLIAVNFGDFETLRIDLARFFVTRAGDHSADDSIFYIPLGKDEAVVLPLS